MIEPTAKKPPILVEVDDEEPVHVQVDKPAAPTPIETKSGRLSLPPTTTEQEDAVTAGQRRVNLIWEGTQAAIAMVITLAIVYTAIESIDSQVLTSAFFLIIGFYFSRTNHTNIGGIGKKDRGEYMGR